MPERRPAQHGLGPSGQTHRNGPRQPCRTPGGRGARWTRLWPAAPRAACTGISLRFRELALFTLQHIRSERKHWVGAQSAARATGAFRGPRGHGGPRRARWGRWRGPGASDLLPRVTPREEQTLGTRQGRSSTSCHCFLGPEKDQKRTDREEADVPACSGARGAQVGPRRALRPQGPVLSSPARLTSGLLLLPEAAWAWRWPLRREPRPGAGPAAGLQNALQALPGCGPPEQPWRPREPATARST